VRLSRAVTVAALLTAATAALIYAAGAAMLLAYPYEWDPSEGGGLEGAWRLVHDPGALYPHGTVVPHPFPLPPLYALLNVPFHTVAGARALSVALLVASLVAIYKLVRRSGSPALGLVAAATLLAAMGDSFWLTLARVDGLMIALLLWAAVVGLPPELRRGAATLSWRRSLATAALLVLACLAKPSAALHGAPLVLAWLVVDVRSFGKLAAATVALGLACVGALQLSTHGGFLEATRLWLAHGQSTQQLLQFTSLFFTTHAAIVVALLVVTVVAWQRGGAPLRDPAWALWLGGAAGILMLGKFGAWTSYLLLWVAAFGVLVGRLARRAGETLALGLMAAVIVVGLVRFQFPVPTAQDRATAAFLREFVVARGRPLLAAKLESLYAAVGQPEEIEADGFPWLMKEHAPGIERIFERFAHAEYRTVVVHPYVLPLTAQRALAARYVPVGVCDIGFWHSTYRYALWVPRGESVTFAPPEGTACAASRN
jgi:hypothetical protein